MVSEALEETHLKLVSQNSISGPGAKEDHATGRNQSCPAEEKVMLIDSPMEETFFPFGFNEECSEADALSYPKTSLRV